MSSDLTGKVALVTGASGGIGTALVEALVERGATVVATSRNHQNPTTPGRVHHRQLDVADLESLQPFVAQVIDEFGSLDLVLPNAGIAPVHTLPEIDLTTWQETLTVNLTAPAPGDMKRLKKSPAFGAFVCCGWRADAGDKVA